MEWSNKQTLNLIKLLHVQESLWNVRNKIYRDRQKRKDALAAIALQMNMSIHDVDKKIINLKNQFNREVNKMKTKSCGTDDVCVSPWYAFKPLSFLKNNNLPKRTRSSDSSDGQNDNVESNFNSSAIEDYEIHNVFVSDESSIKEKKGVKRSIETSDHTQKEVLSILKDNFTKYPAKDEFDVFGEYVAIELRSVIGKRNVLELKKQIQDLIYLTKLNEINNNYGSVSSRSRRERPSETRVLTEDNQVIEVAANLVLQSEIDEVNDSNENESSNILMKLEK